MTAMDKLLREIAGQIDWIESHGRTITGYVQRYGSAKDPYKHGDGGEAIYAADVGALNNLLKLGRRYDNVAANSLRTRALGCGARP